MYAHLGKRKCTVGLSHVKWKIRASCHVSCHNALSVVDIVAIRLNFCGKVKYCLYVLPEAVGLLLLNIAVK